MAAVAAAWAAWAVWTCNTYCRVFESKESGLRSALFFGSIALDEGPRLRRRDDWGVDFARLILSPRWAGQRNNTWHSRPWAQALQAASASRTPIAEADWYFALLRPLCAKVDVWRTTYYHALSGGPGAIVEWFKGSGLRPFLEPLDAPLRAAYLEKYMAAVAREYPVSPDGSVLLPFPRLFWVAVR